MGWVKHLYFVWNGTSLFFSFSERCHTTLKNFFHSYSIEIIEKKSVNKPFESVCID